MKTILMVCVAVSCMFFCCEKEHPPVKELPACLQQRIEQIKQQPPQNPAAEIHEYTYNGQTVYLVNAACCDQYNLVITETCNTLCAPSGGITGKGDGRCADFDKQARHIRRVWKDAR